MNASHSESPDSFLVLGLRMLLALTVFGAIGVAAYLTWQQYGDEAVADPRFLVKADKLEITPQPDWIRTDIRAEVVRDGSLEQASLLEPEITIQIAQAFTIHPWVAKVRRVSKHATGKVTVEIEYRRPIAMVEVEGGLLPVDTDGVLLPTGDFSAEKARDFPRVFVENARPLGPIGTPWGDQRVTGAAQISGLLGSVWQRLDLYRIVAKSTPEQQIRHVASYEIVTREGLVVHWGNAPQSETTGEPTAIDKVQRLVQYVEQHGLINWQQSAAEIDLRNRREITVVPRTANRLEIVPD